MDSSGAHVTVNDEMDSTRSIAAGDIDGDGDCDLAGVEQGTDTVMWWANTSGDGASWTSAQIIVDSSTDPAIVRLADLDLDGDLDLALAAGYNLPSDSLLAWYENSIGDGIHLDSSCLGNRLHPAPHPLWLLT